MASPVLAAEGSVRGMTLFWGLLALVVLFVVGSAQAMRYFTRQPPSQRDRKEDDDDEP